MSDFFFLFFALHHLPEEIHCFTILATSYGEETDLEGEDQGCPSLAKTCKEYVKCLSHRYPSRH